MKWSLSFEEDDMMRARKKIPLKEEEKDGAPALKKYVKRGHMPAVIRRASFYERMKENPPDRFDSFREDESKSNGSSASNYSNQDFHSS